MNRETIYAALFAKVTGAAGFITTSRRLQHWADVPTPNMPALFQAQKDQKVERNGRLPAKHHLPAELYVYVHAGDDPNVAPAPTMNALIDAIENALAPDDPDKLVCTLGGLVTHCWISGDIKTDEGTLGPLSVAIIPIDILAEI